MPDIETNVESIGLDWHQYIHVDPNILQGKPIIKGTRLAAQFILTLFAMGWTEQQVLEGYPSLTSESLRAVFAYAADQVSGEPMSAVH